MGFKMKGWGGYQKPSAFKYHKPEHKAPNDGNNDGNDDQSKEAARKRGDICPKCDKLKGNCTCKKKEGEDRPEPTWPGTDEYRKAKDIPKKEYEKRGLKKNTKKTTKDKKTKDKNYQNKREALLNKGFTQKDADWMITRGGQ